MASFETVGSEVGYEGFSRVRTDQVRMPDGEVARREVVEHDDAVAVVPLMDDGTVVLLRQYRHPLGRYVLEIPAGKRDVAGEDPVQTAQRELREEVGLRADTLEELVTFHNSAGWTDESTTVYLGTGVAPAPAPAGFQPQAEEAEMEVLRLPLEEVVAMARRGEVVDAKTIIGVLLASER